VCPFKEMNLVVGDDIMHFEKLGGYKDVY